MRTGVGRMTLVVFGAAVILLASGCTNWEKKYKALDVEHQNLKGLYENCSGTLDQSSGEKAQLAQRVSEGQRTIDELQRQIKDLKKSPGEVTGFGDQYDVAIDSAKGTITVTLPDAILFDSGKATLKKSSMSELSRIISVLDSKYSGKELDLVGYTDTDPIQKSKWADNWQLSTERALAVVRYLSSKGVSDERLRAIGCGETRSIASNDSGSGKAKNRRVELVVHMR